MADWPTPANDTGVGLHSDPNAYMKPADPHGYADDLYAHGVRWFLHWYYDEGAVDFIRIMRQRGIEVIGRPGPAKMPRLGIDMGVIDAYVAAGVRFFIIGNEFNLNEEWETDWHQYEKPVRMVADQFIKYADSIRPKGAWCLTPPPSLGGHMLHREWFTRFLTALSNIAKERGQSLEQLLWHCGIGIHCRSVGNPLTAGPSDYDCSAREWEWFDAQVKQFVGHSLPMANTEAFDEPQWLPKVGNDYDWGLWQSRNLEQMRWFNPANAGYRYPLHVIANCHWVIHADRFSPWPQCGLIGNYPHFQQKGDYVTDLWKAMPGAINWVRGEPQPQPPTPPPVPPEPEEPVDIEFVGLSEEMIAALSISGPADPTQHYWKVVRVEIQPETDNQSAWVIAPKGCYPQLFWGSGGAIMPWKAPDPYAPPGARDGAYSQALFHSWGNYGVVMEANSEALFGIGLYGPSLEMTYTAHRPTLVYYKLVQPAETPPEPPEPPLPPVQPPTPPSTPYGFGAALNARLVAAGLARMVDVRDAIEAKYMDASKVGIRSVDAKDRLAGFWSITFHHTASKLPLNVDAIAQNHSVTQGWGHIAYHFIIDKAGTVWWVKRLKYYGPHSGNVRFNKYSIPVTAHGDFTSESPSGAQLKALKCVTDSLEEWVGEHQGKAQPLPIVRHKDIVNTACPGNLYEKYREFINK